MGALGGHMSHVYENMDMKFVDLLQLFNAVSSGEIKVSEKVDGQNLYFRYDSNTQEPRFARNAGHANVGGLTREAMTADFIRKGAGDPGYSGVIKTFDDGMDAIQKAMLTIDPLILSKIFYRPDLYANCEVMSGDNRNIVVYNGNFIVMHGLDLVGNQWSDREEAAADLEKTAADARNAFNVLVQAVDNQESRIAKQNWQVIGPRIVALKDLTNGDFMSRLEASVGSVIDDTGLTLTNTFKDFVAYHLMSVINKTFAVKPSQQVFDMILTLVTEDSSEKKQRLKAGAKISLRTMKALHGNDGDYNALRNIASSANAKSILGIILEPFAQITVQFSSEVLSGAESYFMKDTEASRSALYKMTEMAIERIPARIEGLIKTGTVNKKAAAEAASIQKRFDKNMARMKSLDTISSGIEGVVFEYPPMSRRFYKFTGGFAPANQLLGLLGWDEKAQIMAAAQV